MAATYEAIASTTLGTSATNITFSNIPGTYTDLVIVARGEFFTSSNDLYTQFNGDTATNYSNLDMRGNGISPATTTTSNVAYIRHNQSATNDPIWIIQVMSYANTSANKMTLSSFAMSATTVERTIGMWRSTSAITSIRIYPSGGDSLVSGFTACLYGIKAA